MASPDQIAKAFVDHYYSQFDNNRGNLAGLYRPESMLTFEGNKFQGEAIIKHLTSMPMKVVQHKVETIDPQPSPGNGLIVFVGGMLAVDNEHDKPMRFTQVFNLQPIPGQNGFYVLNDIFRLNIN